MISDALRAPLILGAGPAGLAAAHRLAEHGVGATVIEREATTGGLCRSFTLDGCTFDIGPHVFLPRSDEVRAFWHKITAAQQSPPRGPLTWSLFHNGLHPSPTHSVRALPRRQVLALAAGLVRARTSRRAPRHAEDVLLAARGAAIYELYYRPREHNLWGLPLHEIAATSYSKHIKHFEWKRLATYWGLRFPRRRAGTGTPEGPGQPAPTMHPHRGAGSAYARLAQMCESAAGTRFLLGREVIGASTAAGQIRAVSVRDRDTGDTTSLDASAVISTIPLPALARAVGPAHCDVLDAQRLQTRAIVLVLLTMPAGAAPERAYTNVYSEALRAFRVTNFSRLGERMANERGHAPVSVEYNCFEGDALWQMEDEELVSMATRECSEAGLFAASAICASAVKRVPDAYPIPAIGAEARAQRAREQLKQLTNLQVIGRNGRFQYNQMGHSIEDGWRAAESLLGLRRARDTDTVLDTRFDVR